MPKKKLKVPTPLMTKLCFYVALPSRFYIQGLSFALYVMQGDSFAGGYSHLGEDLFAD